MFIGIRHDKTLIKILGGKKCTCSEKNEMGIALSKTQFHNQDFFSKIIIWRGLSTFSESRNALQV